MIENQCACDCHKQSYRSTSFCGLCLHYLELKYEVQTSNGSIENAMNNNKETKMEIEIKINDIICPIGHKKILRLRPGIRYSVQLCAFDSKGEQEFSIEASISELQLALNKLSYGGL